MSMNGRNQRQGRGEWRLRHPLMALGLVALVFASGLPAHAQSLRQGVSAFQRQDYVAASRVFISLAERGNAPSQTYLGFLFETGRGVPQNYTEAAMWYRRAAEQGDSRAQYSGVLQPRGEFPANQQNVTLSCATSSETRAQKSESKTL